MNRLMIQAMLALSLCTVVAAQQSAQPASTSAAEAQPGAVAERNEALKSARTISIKTDTIYLTVSTIERALMKQKDWDKLDLNILANEGCGDLELQINRVVFTHIHTYTLTDRSTGIVLASGRVRALDGVIASGPMAEQIVKILSAARLPARAASGE